jgi:uroporphyrin-III C-methyltransferase/precorrin-2 dehydrogenase/sirohydrochlorin ferrochelatase
MDYLPLFARLDDQPCLVVGGGGVAARKAHALLRAGGRVTLRAAVFGDAVRTMARDPRVELRVGRFVPDEVAAFTLVVAATDEAEVNRQVARAAQTFHTLCNVVDDGDASSFIMPAIVDRSPLVVAISSGGHSPVLVRRLKTKLERLLPARLGDVARLLGRFRDAAKQRFPDLKQRRHFWEQLLDSDQLAPVANGTVEGDDIVVDALTLPQAPPKGIGYLVGAGPGDPELLTLKAQRLLADADIVLYDRLIDPALLDHARRDAEFIDVGKTPNGHSTSQTQINQLLVKHVTAGRRVVRLKGGDPFIFGRGGEELEALEDAGLAVQVVPGITAAQGCAASIGLPLTRRGAAQAVTLVTAHGADNEVAQLDWDALCAQGQTLVFYMGVGRLPSIRLNLLRRLPAITPVAIVERGTTPEERVHRTDLASMDTLIENKSVNAPALIFVGTTPGLSAVKANVA